MNVLLTKFPKEIKIGSKFYPIKSDFRIWIKFETEFIKTKDNNEKIELILNMLEKYPPLKTVTDFETMINAVTSFYNCGEPLGDESSRNKHRTTSVYNFDKDQFHIYTDFLQFYQIDLNEIRYMHWWKFKQLFIELPEKSKIKTVMMYRSIQITSKMSSEHRQFYAKMKKLYSLEDTRTQQEKIKSAGSVLAGYMKNK